MNAQRLTLSILAARGRGALALACCTVLGGALAACSLQPSVALAENCPNEALRSGPSAHLPDCRAYEQATPVFKNGGLFIPGNVAPGVGGTATLTLESFAAIAGIENNAGIGGESYSLKRTGSGWVTTPMVSAASQYEALNPPQYISPILNINSLDNSSTLILAQGKANPQGEAHFVSRSTSGATAGIGPATPPGTPLGEPGSPIGESPSYGEQQEGVEPVGVSNDMSHLLFTIEPREGFVYWPFDGTKSSGASLYEYVGSGNTTPMLVGVDNAGKLISSCQTALGGDRFTASGAEEHNAVSGDGSTVFFTAFACGSSPPVNELFARIGNGQPGAHTVAISEPSAADCAVCDTATGVLASAHFEGASTDGSKVFYTTAQPLLGGDTSSNIYEYDFNSPAGQPKVVRVSGADATVSGPTADVEGVVRTSEDGSHVYFVARGILPTSANGQGQFAQAGANNLYVFERDAQYPGGRTAFIGGLSSADSELWRPEDNRQADATPDGRFLVFVSRTDLTPDDTSVQGQVFEYDAQTGRLVRVSIGQRGYNGNGNDEALGEARILNPRFNDVSRPQAYWSGLTMTADGAYVFFESSLALTPQAINNAQAETLLGGSLQVFPVENIYEYHEGQIHLISDGRDISGASSLIGIDPSGTDVLIQSGDSLVPQDTDSNYDVYDARIDGGFPAPAAPAECSGDGCQGPLSGAPVLLSPGSEFQAGGNPTQAAPASAAASKPQARKRKARVKAGKGRRRAARRAGRRGHRHGQGGRS
jgi:hypothetical protein